MQSNCKKFFRRASSLSLVLALSACAADDDHDHDHDHDHANEIISRVELTFTPDGGGEALVFEFDDPDGDGGVSGSGDRIELVAGTSYTLDLRFENRIVDPVEDITLEIAEEAEEHFVFITGDVTGPASSSTAALLAHGYADRESDYGGDAIGEDLPVGLRNSITADAAGSGQLRVILRHLPELNGEPQKSGDLPQLVAAGEDLPGSIDVDVVFDLVVE